MKKHWLYTIGALILCALIVIALSNWNRPKRFDERISLRETDKIPYGFNAARQLLPSLFPAAVIKSDKELPGEWNGIDVSDSNQAVILVAPAIYATEEELNNLVSFIQKGNYVFIITPFLNARSETFFGVSSISRGWIADTADRLEIALSAPRFANQQYSYPGRNSSRYFQLSDSNDAIILGKDKNEKPNFLQLNSFKGSLFLHYSPLAFSNYFILHRNNISYYESAFSVIPATVKTIVWNEYYFSRTNEQGGKQQEPNWLRVLLRYESFKWALLIALATLAIYLLSEMRRRQRFIPAFVKPKNESLDFVETIGRLYYDKKDHHDLARKMAFYFLDHVRQQYKLPTEDMDEAFVTALHIKSGYPVNELNEITGFMQYLRDTSTISPGQLSHFYQQLETFYKTT